jgi:hypothetical protein
MKRLRKFLSLPAAERKLLIRAFLLVAAIRLGLWTISFRRLQRILNRAAAKRPQAEAVSVERAVWAVQVASRRVPGASCLTQAMAAQTLLRRGGQASRLWIGVAKDLDRKFKAHAWIETQGRVLLGGPDFANYVALPPLDAKALEQ